MVAEIEVAVGQSDPGRRVIGADEGGIDPGFALGALVAKLAFQPEHSEVVSGDGVDIESGLVVDVERIVVRRIGNCRVDVIDRRVGVRILGNSTPPSIPTYGPVVCANAGVAKAAAATAAR